MNFSFGILLFCILNIFGKVQSQFWKLSSLSEKDLFILETKANMASGICYKQVDAKANTPELRRQTISFCCAGYEQNRKSTAMECNPICSEGCKNGICTAPNVCECYPGYALIESLCKGI